MIENHQGAQMVSNEHQVNQVPQKQDPLSEDCKIKLEYAQSKCEVESVLKEGEEKKIVEEKVSCSESKVGSTLFGEMEFKTRPSKKKRTRFDPIQKIEDVRLVATSFIEMGIDCKRFLKLYPHIDGKFYRNTVEAINNTALNEMEKYLRYECNIQIEKLNRDQKRSIRTQLTRVRDWLGKKDMAQLETFYKYIERKYELKNVEISLEEALKLYKTILQIVKSPFVDVMEDDIRPQDIDPETNRLANLEEKETQEKALVFMLLQHKNLTKVSDCLCEKFGYDIQWSKHGIKQKIKNILRLALKKLIGSVDAYERSIKLFFSESEQCMKLLILSEYSLKVREALFSFYLQKTITLIQLRELVRQVNKFFVQEYKSHGQYECKRFDEEKVKIPKLEDLQSADGQFPVYSEFETVAKDSKEEKKTKDQKKETTCQASADQSDSESRTQIQTEVPTQTPIKEEEASGLKEEQFESLIQIKGEEIVFSSRFLDKYRNLMNEDSDSDLQTETQEQDPRRTNSIEEEEQTALN